MRTDKQREYDREWKKRWRQSPENLAIHQSSMKASYEKHKEERLAQKKEYYIAHEDEIKAKQKEYRNSEAGKLAALTRAHRHRARMLGAFVEDVDRTIVWARDKGICHICEKPVIGLWQLDHIVPLSKGGKHCYDNVAVSHYKCNAGKKDRNLEDYKRSANRY